MTARLRPLPVTHPHPIYKERKRIPVEKGLETLLLRRSRPPTPPLMAECVKLVPQMTRTQHPADVKRGGVMGKWGGW